METFVQPIEPLHTKFGTARIDKTKGYYYISSRIEKNNGKKLHRLIFEDFYGAIPNGCFIHHKDGNKLNNCIMNLQIMSHSNHSKLHHSGRKNSKKSMVKISKSQNTTGYFRVSKVKSSKYAQGFIYSYQYYVGKKQKRIQSVNLKDLEMKVKNKGLDWFKLKESDLY